MMPVKDPSDTITGLAAVALFVGMIVAMFLITRRPAAEDDRKRAHAGALYDSLLECVEEAEQISCSQATERARAVLAKARGEDATLNQRTATK